jgi:hypothetical protein
MPSVISFDTFRLRWRSKSTAKPPLPEDDSDRSSSPDEPRRISLQMKSARDRSKALPGIPTAIHDEVVNEKTSDHFLEQPVEATEKLVGLLR